MDSFIFRTEWVDITSHLAKEQQDAVIHAVIDYAINDGDFTPQLDPAGMVAFKAITLTLNRDIKRYNAKKENGKKGGAPKGNRNATKTTENNLTETVVECETTENNLNIPLPSPLPSPLPLHSPSFSSLSSFSSDAEENEIEKKETKSILEFLVLERNMSGAEAEISRIIASNNLQGRRWAQMDWVGKESVLVLWEQRPAQKPRFSQEELTLWKNIYERIAENAPPDICCDALSDTLAWSVDKRNTDVLTLSCTDRLREYMERHLDTLREPVRELMNYRNCNVLRYKTKK